MGAEEKAGRRGAGASPAPDPGDAAPGPARGDARRKRLTERELNIRQLPYRLHSNDHKLLRKLLVDDETCFQHFMDACVQAYLRGDPLMLKFIAAWKDVSSVPEEERSKYLLSHRERMALLDEIGDT